MCSVSCRLLLWFFFSWNSRLACACDVFTLASIGWLWQHQCCSVSTFKVTWSSLSLTEILRTQGHWLLNVCGCKRLRCFSNLTPFFLLFARGRSVTADESKRGVSSVYEAASRAEILVKTSFESLSLHLYFLYNLYICMHLAVLLVHHLFKLYTVM